MSYLISKYKFSKLPSELIYEFPILNSQAHPPQRIFKMFSLETGKQSGFLVCHKSNLHLRDDYKGSSLAIDFITAPQNQNGYGTKLLNFAKNLSKQIGCNGHILLKSDISLMPNKIPHLFYRKNGFTTLDKKLDKKIDKFIKADKIATYKDFSSELMFYPAPKEPQKDSLFFKTINNLTRIVKNILK